MANYVLTLLVRAAVEGKQIALPEGFALACVLGDIKSHNIAVLAYYGAIRCGIDRRTPAMQELFAEVTRSMAVSYRQEQELWRIRETFEANGIDYLSLKGAVLRGYYPKAEMRAMGDLDILIREEQYDRIRPLMKELGFRFIREHNHELAWKRGVVEVELHRQMADYDDVLAFGYYGDGWHFAKRASADAFCHHLSPEDTYVHLFSHFARHYRFCGIGIRHLTDLWVYRRAHPELNEPYIRRELAKLRLDVFYENILRTLDVWFADGTDDETTKLITDEIISSGQFGTRSNAEASAWLMTEVGAGRHTGSRLLWRKLFPPYRIMKQKYPAVKKVPVLLPFFWLYRWLQILFIRPENAKRFLLRKGGNKESAIQQRRKTLEQAGLPFDSQQHI